MRINISTEQRKAVMLSALFFIMVLSFGSCKKDKNELGLSIFPASDEVGLVTTDTFSLYTYSELSDSIITDELTTASLLGSYQDPYFGKVAASIYTQIRLDGAVDFTPDGGTLSDLAVDSIVLYIALSGHYGNLTEQTFEVYQLTEDFYLDSSYYSNRILSNSGLNLVASGEGTIVPNTNAPGYVAGEITDESILRIPLSIADFATPIINESGTGVLDANDGDGKFVEWFKGLYITVNNPSQNNNEGAILYTDLLSGNSKITMYYRDLINVDTIQFDFNINSSCAHFTNFEQDYTGTLVESQIGDSTEGQELFFLQTMGGVRPKIAIPSFEHLLDSGNVIINKAELFLPVQYYLSDAYVPPSELFLVLTNDDGTISFIPDYSDDRGGNYVSSTNSYTFNVTRYLNQVISGNYENVPLTIVSSGNGVTANRVVFNGPETILKDKPKLIITYSKFE